ncbi:hypothetical protein [Rhodoferax sp.]|uniref:hypothetical protein n=1 Tax=Rhodoferax sp. TaxID=50421 RepID=UPI002633CD19|nr:hypothetical protein [Rhodoferax sp.]MDD2919333.1 hypothetical protein [Rhodoferax sp.]
MFFKLFNSSLNKLPKAVNQLAHRRVVVLPSSIRRFFCNNVISRKLEMNKLLAALVAGLFAAGAFAQAAAPAAPATPAVKAAPAAAPATPAVKATPAAPASAAKAEAAPAAKASAAAKPAKKAKKAKKATVKASAAQ